MKEQKQSVLACVTGQYDCDRIINSARQIADETGCGLRVLSVLRPTSDYSGVSAQIEYLYTVAKKARADMTILFDKDPSGAAARFAEENNVKRIVTGMAGSSRDSFIVSFLRQSPATAISMISKDNRVYSLELSPCCIENNKY